MNIRSAYSFRTINVAGAIITAAMITAACGSDDDTTVAPATAAETTTTAPETDGTVPIRGEHPCDLGEGQIEGEYCLVDGQWWFNAGAGNWIERDGPPPVYDTPVLEPDEPTEETIEEPPADHGVADEDHPHIDVEGFEDVDPIPEDVICGDGLTLMEEFIAENDNGCRPDVCDHGRGDDGQCLTPEEELLTGEEAAEAADEDHLLSFDEYAPDTECTEVSLGVCEDADGTLHCHDTNTGWAECPGQPSSDPCQHDENDPLSFAGSGTQITGQIPTVTLTPGVWTVTACVRNNDIATGTPDGFLMSLIPDLNAGAWYRLPDDDTEGFSCGAPGMLHCAAAVVNGEWSRDIVVPNEDESPVLPMQVSVIPEGGGSWTVRFSIVD